MRNELPDVISDHCTDAAKRLGLNDVHELFLLAAHESGHNDIHGCAQTAFYIWSRQGYQALPDAVKEFILQVCNGERIYQGRSVIRSMYA